jgi:hypothetical protein
MESAEITIAGTWQTKEKHLAEKKPAKIINMTFAHGSAT